MLKRLLRSSAVVTFGSALAAGYIRFVYRTSRVRRDPPDTSAKLFAQHPQIFAMWHGQFLMLPMIKPAEPADVAIMVARHADAEALAETLRRFGMRLIRGAGAGARKRDRGGATAMREALRALGQGATVAMTADVPPGPARKAGAGIATLAKLSGRPVVPCAMASSRYLALRSWSAFTINLPFSDLAIVVGDPIFVPPDADERRIETACLEIEKGLNAVTRRAYELAGAKDPLGPLSRAEAAREGIALWVYRVATRLGAPLAPLILRWRLSHGKEEPDRQPERFGLPSTARPDGFLAWFHAASVGEVNAVLPVIATIAAEHPHIRLLLTTGTVTSARLARDRLPPGAIHQYVPMDSPAYVCRFLDHWRPNLAVLVESEIWPNLILETKARGVPLVLINGRMSRPTFRRWRKRPSFARPLFSAFDLVLAQNATLAQRFSQLGACDAIGVGNLKIDAPPPPTNETLRSRLASLLKGRSVLVATSTHPGEEEIVVAAHLEMRRKRPDLLTIIVPRHPHRGQALAQQFSNGTLKVGLRSAGAMPDADTDLYIADTIGEIGMFYTLAKVAFVGGSLVPHGGQNPVEAIKLGTVVLTGPHWQNFADSYEQLLKAGGAKEVADAAGLAQAALAMLEDDAARQAMLRNAEGAIEQMSGALPRTMAALSRFLPPQDSFRHAS